MAILDEDSDKIAAVMAIEMAMAMAILVETTSVISDVTVWASVRYWSGR